MVNAPGFAVHMLSDSSRINFFQLWRADLGPVPTNPFSNENGAVLLCFQKDLRPHLSFSYRFRRPHYNAVSAFKTLLYPQCAWSNGLSAILGTHGRVVWRPVVSILMTSLFSDSKKTAFSKSIVFKSLLSGERFRMAPFSVIVFGVVVWTIAVSGAKQLRFRLKTD